MTRPRTSHTVTLLPSGRVLVIGGYSTGGIRSTSAEIYDPGRGIWEGTGNLTTGRALHTATLLRDGRVLVTGGETPEVSPTRTVEIWDPSSGAFSTVADMLVARRSHSATELVDGRVLVAGGSSSGSDPAEIFDPLTGDWTSAGVTERFRFDHRATLLASGRVLLSGGDFSGATAEVFDPIAGTWTATGPMSSSRRFPTATRLPSGLVLVAGGLEGSSYLESSEIYDPETGTWSPGPSMSVARVQHSASRLPNGWVAVVGGNSSTGKTSSSEAYDPGSGAWVPLPPAITARAGHASVLLATGDVLVTGNGTSAERLSPIAGSWQPVGSLVHARSSHRATVLPSGEVLVAGAGTAPGTPELFDAATGSWTSTGSMATGQRSGATLTLLPNGEALVAGGFSSVGGHLSSAEIFDRSSGTWRPAASMSYRRSSHTATLLASGQVLVAGGSGDPESPDSAEIYDPGTESWSVAAPLWVGRSSHAAIRLFDGSVLVAGGRDVSSESLDDAEVYDARRGVWVAVSPMQRRRASLTTSALASGNVLVTGGSDGGPLAANEIYDPATRTWGIARSMATARSGHAATLLPSGKVLVTGGNDGSGATASVEAYDSLADEWLRLPDLSESRSGHTTTLLPTGRVLVAAGYGGLAAGLRDSSEVYDIAASGDAWRPFIDELPELQPGDVLLVTGTNLRGAFADSDTPVFSIGRPDTAAIGMSVEAFVTTSALLSVPSVSAGYWMLSATATGNAGGRIVRVAAAAPSAQSQSLSTPEDVPLLVQLDAADPNGDPLSWSILQGPSLGSLAGTAPSLTFTPAPNVSGSDSFTFQVDDGVLSSAIATVLLSITPVNDPPIAAKLDVEVANNKSVPVTLVASDVEGDTLTYTIVDPPVHGTLSGTAPSLVYAPQPGASGADTFRWRANDAMSSSNLGEVTVAIFAANEPPAAFAASFVTSEDVAVACPLQAMDPDGDSLTFSVVSGPFRGVLLGTGQSLVYLPDPNETGPDFFSFTADDGDATSAPALVEIQVTGVNDAPTAYDVEIFTVEDGPIFIDLLAVDVEADALSVQILTPPLGGTLSGEGLFRLYTPASDWNGVDYFTWAASDGTDDSFPAVVAIHVIAESDAPSAPLPVSPAAGDRVESRPTFEWQPAVDVDGDAVLYIVTIEREGDMVSEEEATSTTLTSAVKLSSGDYTWRVAASDGSAASASMRIPFRVAAAERGGGCSVSGGEPASSWGLLALAGLIMVWAWPQTMGRSTATRSSAERVASRRAPAIRAGAPNPPCLSPGGAGLPR